MFFIQISCTLCNVLYLFSKQSERRGHKNVVINFLFFYGFSYSISTALHLFEVIPPTYRICTCINKSIDCRITVETTIIACFIFCPLHFYSQSDSSSRQVNVLYHWVASATNINNPRTLAATLLLPHITHTFAL